MPTKPRRFAGNKGPGRPPHPELEIYVEFEASRRLTGRSINQHAKLFPITLLTWEGLNPKRIVLRGAALRSHIQAFIRKHLHSAPDPLREGLDPLRDGLERMIQQRIACWQT